MIDCGLSKALKWSAVLFTLSCANMTVPAAMKYVSTNFDVVVTVEEVVDGFDSHPNALVLPHWTVDAIIHVPGGAHPSYAHGYYPRDNAAYIEWDGIAADRAVFLAWMEENVLAVDESVFASRASWSATK